MDGDRYFFVLSGYLIRGILLRLKESCATGGSYWSSFYFCRILRILPPYIAFLVVLTRFFGCPGGTFGTSTFFCSQYSACARQGHGCCHGSVVVAGRGGTILFYLAMAGDRVQQRRAASYRAWLNRSFPLLRAISTPLFNTHFPIYSLTIFRADTLAMGAFIALASSRDPQWIGRHRRMAVTSAVAALALLMGLSVVPGFRAGANTVIFNSIGYSLSAACLGSTLIYVLGAQSGLLYTILTAPPLRYLGLISYTFYLYHEAVLLKVGQYFHSPIPIALVAFSATISISVVSWHFYETPILGYSKKKFALDSRSKSGTSRAILRPVESGKA